jgi:hypothetical protein
MLLLESTRSLTSTGILRSFRCPVHSPMAWGGPETEIFGGGCKHQPDTCPTVLAGYNGCVVAVSRCRSVAIKRDHIAIWSMSERVASANTPLTPSCVRVGPSAQTITCVVALPPLAITWLLTRVGRCYQSELLHTKGPTLIELYPSRRAICRIGESS